MTYNKTLFAGKEAAALSFKRLAGAERPFYTGMDGDDKTVQVHL
ncbi:hypothetical protein [Paeniglutamicibacter sp.]